MPDPESDDDDGPDAEVWHCREAKGCRKIWSERAGVAERDDIVWKDAHTVLFKVSGPENVPPLLCDCSPDECACSPSAEGGSAGESDAEGGDAGGLR